MVKKRQRQGVRGVATGAPRAGRKKPEVVVCRGGDCGSRRKHPDLDHPAQLRLIRERLTEEASVLVSKCLDACERSNVIVVLPGAAGEDESEPMWVGEVNDLDSTADVIDWVRQGGPGVAELPVLVEINAFTPTRRNRRELDSEIAT